MKPVAFIHLSETSRRPSRGFAFATPQHLLPCSWNTKIVNVFCFGTDSKYALGHFFILGLISHPDVMMMGHKQRLQIPGSSRITEKEPQDSIPPVRLSDSRSHFSSSLSPPLVSLVAFLYLTPCAYLPTNRFEFQ